SAASTFSMNVSLSIALTIALKDIISSFAISTHASTSSERGGGVDGPCVSFLHWLNRKTVPINANTKSIFLFCIVYQLISVSKIAFASLLSYFFTSTLLGNHNSPFFYVKLYIAYLF